MQIKAVLRTALAVACAGGIAFSSGAQEHKHSMGTAPVAEADSRLLVTMPEPMHLHTIANMRDHLMALQEIDVALFQNVFDKAATIAEQRLGMSSL